ncbi:hypothetical protein HOY80DRAFT_791281 [Tuber brumale]|nr:hypothetical protein HOY80DRAFT_791281 [Tuber brumale]
MSQTTIKSFFKSSHFAVVGATPGPDRCGRKVFAWYLSHSLPVTGIHPRAPTVLTHETLASLKDLENPKRTSVSFITPPQATQTTLEVAAEIGIPAVWPRPGRMMGIVCALRRRRVWWSSSAGSVYWWMEGWGLRQAGSCKWGRWRCGEGGVL